MIHRASLLLGFAIFLLGPSMALAQEEEEEFTFEEAEPPPEEAEEMTMEPADESMDFGVEGEAEMSFGEEEAAAAGKPLPKLGENRVAWQDIVVVVRKPFLKDGRLELIPSWGMTLNDNMIRHFALNGQLNYFLTDVLAVGVEAQIFQKDLREAYDLIALQHRRLPTLNKYNFAGSFNFHYSPIYGKFAFLNRSIIHWEGLVTAGVGVTQSEIIPRDPSLPSWTNMLITPNVGVTMRVYLANWLTVNIGVRDYIFVDKYEAVNRSPDQSVEQAMSQADSNLVNHIMFQAGVSFWIPPSFEYTTFR